MRDGHDHRIESDLYQVSPMHFLYHLMAVKVRIIPNYSNEILKQEVALSSYGEHSRRFYFK